MTIASENHPFVQRIRAERTIIYAVNGCREVVCAELVGTSEKAIARWYASIPGRVKRRGSVIHLRECLREAGQITKLASNGSHRGAMLPERVQAERVSAAVDRVIAAATEVSATDTTR